VQVACERVELSFPEPPVLLDPRGGGVERPGDEPAPVDASVARSGEQAGAFQHLQVPRDRRQRDAKRRGQSGDRRGPLGEAYQDRPPRRVGERREDGVEPGGAPHRYPSPSAPTGDSDKPTTLTPLQILNLIVKYKDRPRRCQDGAVLDDLVAERGRWGGRRDTGPPALAGLAGAPEDRDGLDQ
jgi:hypothetical protein